MTEVNQASEADDKLYLHGEFNSDAVVFYRGEVVDTFDRPHEETAARAWQRQRLPDHARAKLEGNAKTTGICRRR
jgi:hypothetical protein